MRANRRNAFSLVPCKSILKADSFVDARVQEFLDGELTTEFESGRGVGALLSVLGQLRGLPPPAPLASLRHADALAVLTHEQTRRRKQKRIGLVNRHDAPPHLL